MTTIVGIRFREVGKIYYFAPGDLDIKPGDKVIVETARGVECGTCIIGKREVSDDSVVQPLKEVRRIATKDDEERMLANREKEKDAFIKCKEKIIARGLDMKLIAAEYTFDNSKILFYFTADGRVDFRELVKDLASIFKIRIELRQVGVRDETKLMGGLGGCGRELCCASYLSDFVPVSIRMAKEQNLSLNPQKISGVCGRLMCCLKNEAETYEDLNTRLPKQGDKVTTKDGREGIAETVNVLRERIRVLFIDDEGNKELEEFPASELKFKPRRKKAVSSCSEEEATADLGDAESGSDDSLNFEENDEIEAIRESVVIEASESDIFEPEESEETQQSKKSGRDRPRQDRPRRRNSKETGSGQDRPKQNGSKRHGPKAEEGSEETMSDRPRRSVRPRNDKAGNARPEGEASEKDRPVKGRNTAAKAGRSREQTEEFSDKNYSTDVTEGDFVPEGGQEQEREHHHYRRRRRRRPAGENHNSNESGKNKSDTAGGEA